MFFIVVLIHLAFKSGDDPEKIWYIQIISIMTDKKYKKAFILNGL
jgi:hypothetical protein